MKLFACLLAIALLEVANAASAPQPSVYIELTGLSQTLVLESDGSFTSRMPIKSAASGPTLADLEPPRIFDVQYRDGRSNAIVADFEADINPADAHHGDSLVIQTTPNSQNLRPGAYTVTVHVAPKSSPDKAQEIVLVLQKPAPTLSLGPTVVIKHQNNFLGLGWSRTDAGELQLHEDSRNAGLTGIQLRVVPDQGEEHPENMTLQLPAQPFSINAAGEFKASIVPTGSFPLGTSKGKIEIRTPDLTNISSVSYEVRTREHPALILLVAALGAFFGWLVRVFLQHRQELGSASIQASTVAEAIDDARRLIKDRNYGARLEQIRNAVQSASAGGNSAQILQSAKDATESLKKLQTEFETDRAAELAATRPINDVLLKRWNLPASVQTALESARTKLDRVSALLTDNDLTGAKTQREALTNTELVDLINTALEWRLYLSRYFEALVTSAPPIADPERENLRKTAVKLAENLPQAPTVVSTTPAAADAELDTVHRLSFASKDAIDHLGATARDFLAWGIRTLGSIPPAALAEAEHLTQLTTAMTGAAAGDLATPQARLEEPRGRSQLLREAWIGLLRKVTPTADLKKVEELMANSQWTEAITTATKPKAGGGMPLDASQPVQPTRPIAEPPPGHERPIHEATSPERAPALRAPLEGTARERQRLQRQIAHASFWQGVLVGILFMVGVYYLHIDTWVGTPKEILSLMMLAFITDLTADSVLKALKPS